MAEDLGVELEWTDRSNRELKAVLDRLKEVSPALATELRKELRATGQDIIDAQTRLLRGPKPGRVQKAGSEYRLVNAKGRKPYLAKRNIYRYDDSSSGESRGARERIISGLRVAITATAKTSALSIRTSVRKAPLSIIYQARIFRHPVFADKGQSSSKWVWAYQRGIPYFWDPIKQQWERVHPRVLDVIDRALEQISDR